MDHDSTPVDRRHSFASARIAGGGILLGSYVKMLEAGGSIRGEPRAARRGGVAPNATSASRPTASSRSWPRIPRSVRASRRCCRC